MRARSSCNSSFPTSESKFCFSSSVVPSPSSTCSNGDFAESVLERKDSAPLGLALDSGTGGVGVTPDYWQKTGMTWWILCSSWKTSNTDNHHRYLTRIPRIPRDTADTANDGRRLRSLVPPNEGDMGEDGKEWRADWGDVVNGMGGVYWRQMPSFAAASPRARPPRNGHTSTPHLPYVDDSMTTGNTVVRGLKERFAS